MPLVETEAIVLRTYRLAEADKIVSLFTRQSGRVRAVASGAQRTKSRFGGALEPLTYVRLWLYERENRDLGRLNSAEIIESFFDMQKDYSAHLAAQYLAEVAERLLPEKEVNDRLFRLMLAVLRGLKRDSGSRAIDRALVYFDYWFLRVAGVLPDLEACSSCGRKLVAGFFGPNAGTLVCQDCRSPLSPHRVAAEALGLAGPLRESPPAAWFASEQPGQPVRELRRLLETLIEFHVERKLITRELLAQDSDER